MKKSQIKINGVYEVQAGRNKTKVKIVSFNPEKQSWQCETPSGKIISIKDVARFLKEVGVKEKTVERICVTKEKAETAPVNEQPAAPRGPKPLGAMSAMSAAHRVLLEEGRPMQIREIMNAALGKGYCKLNGRTIFNTFNGGIRKEITKKGENSRFKKVGKGLFDAR